MTTPDNLAAARDALRRMCDAPSSVTVYETMETVEIVSAVPVAYIRAILDALDAAEQWAFALKAAVAMSVSLDEHKARIEQAVAAEREACAKVCEVKVRRDCEYGGRWGGYGDFDGDKTGPECAAAIRALAEREVRT